MHIHPSKLQQTKSSYINNNYLSGYSFIDDSCKSACMSAFIAICFLQYSHFSIYVFVRGGDKSADRYFSVFLSQEVVTA
jgi:hypothetical protein